MTQFLSSADSGVGVDQVLDVSDVEGEEVGLVCGHRAGFCGGLSELVEPE